MSLHGVPLSTMRWPTRAQAAARAQRAEQDLAQDVLDSGAEVTVPRFIKLFGRRAASAEDIHKQLAKPEPDLQVRLPEADLPRALKSREDLTQLAVFQGLLPSSVLPQPALAEALLELRQAGWAFEQNDQHISAFAAYQELPRGGVSGLYQSHRLALDLAGVGPLAAFYKAHQLTDYDFFDGKGQPCLPHLATSLGKEAPWLSVERSGELEQFERFQPEQGDLELTRKVFDAPPNQLPALLRGPDYERLLPPALERVNLPALELVELARGLPPHQAWLDKLQDVGPAAQITARLLDQDSWDHFLANPEQDALSFTSGLLARAPRKEVALEVLQALRQDPETRPAAEALEHWQPEDLAQATLKLLANPRPTEAELDKLGRELCQGNREREALLLETRATRGLASARMAAGIYRKLKSYEARKQVFEAGMGSAHGVQLYRPLLEKLKDDDAMLVAEQARVDLQGLPVMQALTRWGQHDALSAARLAVQNADLKTPRELHRLGVSHCTPHQRDLCKVLLQEQKALGPEPARAAELGLELLGGLKSSGARRQIWELVTGDPRQAQEPLTVYASLLKQLCSSDRSRSDVNQDAELLAGKLRPLLSGTPVLQALDRWQLMDDEPSRMLLAAEKRDLTTPESIHQLGVSKLTVYQMDRCLKLLSEQQALGGDRAEAARLALEVLPLLKSRKAKEKVWELATSSPKTGREPGKVYESLLGALVDDGTSYQSEARQADRELAAGRLRPLLQGHPLLQALDRWPLQYGEPEKMVQVLANAKVSSPEEVHEAGLKLVSAYNQPFCEQLLSEQMAFGGERAEAARLGLELFPQLKSRKVRQKAFELATRQPQVGKDPLQLYSLLLREGDQDNDYQREQLSHDAELLAGKLRPLLASSPVLQALDRWPTGMDEVGRIRKALEHPAARTPEEVHAVGVSFCSHYNTALTTALLEEQSARAGQDGHAARLAQELLKQLKSRVGREEVWKMATQRPEQASKPLELYGRLLECLGEGSSSYQEEQRTADALVVAQRARPLLAGSPVLEALDRWGYADDVRRVQTAIQNPAADPLALGQKLCRDSDFALQSALLAEKGTLNSAKALQLVSKCQASPSKTALFRQGMEQQSLSEFYRKTLDAITDDKSDWQAERRAGDAQNVAAQGLSDLASEEAARIVLAWDPPDKVAALRAVLNHPEAKGAELERWLAVAICKPGDQALQDKTLQAQGSELARLTAHLRGQVQSNGARYALWRGAMEQPELRSADAVRAFGKNVLKHYDSQWGRKPQERATLEGLLETYVSVVALAAKPAPTGVLEEGERVVVGGVVVRKKEL